MSNGTNIQWTDETWNPIRGCRRRSAGCEQCYAEHVAARFSGPGLPYEGLIKQTPSGPRWNGKVRWVPERLEDPLRWTKPRRIFVNSMSDLFFEALSFERIACIFAIMAAAPRHTFQVLTKRPERAAEFFAWLEMEARASFDADRPALDSADSLCWHRDRILCDAARAHGVTRSLDHMQPWPLPNVWIGTSVEDQKTADARIPVLLTLPAAVRWVSMEPLIGPVDLTQALAEVHLSGDWPDWVVIGGESGAKDKVRPMEAEWVRKIIADCRDFDVAVFVKQLGRHLADDYGTTKPSKKDPKTLVRDLKGGDPAQWPSWMRVREWPRQRAKEALTL